MKQRSLFWGRWWQQAHLLKYGSGLDDLWKRSLGFCWEVCGMFVCSALWHEDINRAVETKDVLQEGRTKTKLKQLLRSGISFPSFFEVTEYTGCCWRQDIGLDAEMVQFSMGNPVSQFNFILTCYKTTQEQATA